MSNITTQTIRVDLSTDKVIPSAFTHQNDTARTLVFDMYNGGMPYTMTGNTVKFAYKSPIVNGQYSVIAGASMASGTVSGNKVSVTLPSAYTAISGVGMLTMIITPTSGTIRPVNIRLVVHKSADGADSVSGASDFPSTLQEIADEWYDENIADWLNENIETIFDAEAFGTAIDTWLDDHPEATTTVQDGAITSEKLNGASIPFYNVTDYGIQPDSGDIYSELYDLLAEKVYYTGGVVYFPAGKYTVSYTVIIPENTTFIGDGAATEIYFDETDTTFGTALTNAGSNVEVKNMKVSQKTKPPFTTGAHPGCVGFSNNAKEQAIAGKYAHTFTRAEVWNLSAVDLFFDGMYPLQTENSTTHTIHNVTYKNIYCPDGCVSVSSQCNIENVTIENIVCDVFRLGITDDDAILTNITANNVTCQTLLLSNPNATGENIVLNNLQQTKNTRHNSYLSEYCAVFNGNISFYDSTLSATQDEPRGIELFNGIRRYYNCKFNMYDRVAVYEVTPSQLSHDVAENCEFNSTTEATACVLIGYGKHNANNASNFKPMLWGDIHHVYTNGNGINDVTSSFPSQIIVDGERVVLRGYGSFSNDLTNIFTLGTRLSNLPLANVTYLISLWASSNRSGTNIVSWAKIENNVFKSSDLEIAGSSGYNRFLVDTELMLSRIPTPGEIYEAFSY